MPSSIIIEVERRLIATLDSATSTITLIINMCVYKVLVLSLTFIYNKKNYFTFRHDLFDSQRQASSGKCTVFCIVYKFIVKHLIYFRC